MIGLLLIAGLSHAGTPADAPPDAPPDAIAASGAAGPGVRAPVEATVRVTPLDEGPAGLVEGTQARVTVEVRDPSTGLPLSGLYPAAWIDRVQPCDDQVKKLLQGDGAGRPAADLNSFLLVALNDDATVTVIDPLSGFGGTRMLDLVTLPGVGHDWAESADGGRIFVTVPSADRVVVVDTLTWRIAASLPVAPLPERIRIQPDGGYVWVTHGGADAGHVTAIATSDLSVAAVIDVPAGPHDLAITDDSQRVFVTNRDADSVTVIDVARLGVTAALPTGDGPVSVAWSGLADAAIVSHAGDGALVMIGGSVPRVRTRAKVEPGLGQARFTPDGRLAFVVNPAANRLYVVDAVNGRVVHTGPVESGPDQVTFSSDLAFVRHQGTEEIMMFPWRQLGQPGAPLQAVDFTGGAHAPGEGRFPSPADSIVAAPDAAAVLVANPADNAIYYYMEGMAAPMGSFENGGRQPRALLVVDRGLRPDAPGAYSTVATLPPSGEYQVALFLPSPRLVSCTPVTVVAAAARRPAPDTAVVRLVPLKHRARRRLDLELEVHTLGTDAPLDGLEDLSIHIIQAPGRWHSTARTTGRGDGRYEGRFELPASGVYQIYVTCPSKGLSASLAVGVVDAYVRRKRSSP